MPESGTKSATFDLREFVRDTQEQVLTFCFYLMPADAVLDDLVIATFRQFGDNYRRTLHHRDGTRDPLEAKIRLFQIAWAKIQGAVTGEKVNWSSGRDYRKMKSMDENLMQEWERRPPNGENTLDDRFRDEFSQRLRRVDLENRSALVLKDILGFDDEEVLRILALRWGVYRHRLHRGRIDLCELLKGNANRSEGQPERPTVSW